MVPRRRSDGGSTGVLATTGVGCCSASCLPLASPEKRWHHADGCSKRRPSQALGRVSSNIALSGFRVISVLRVRPLLPFRVCPVTKRGGSPTRPPASGRAVGVGSVCDSHSATDMAPAVDAVACDSRQCWLQHSQFGVPAPLKRTVGTTVGRAQGHNSLERPRPIGSGPSPHRSGEGRRSRPLGRPGCRVGGANTAPGWTARRKGSRTQPPAPNRPSQPRPHVSPRAGAGRGGWPTGE